jgi:hypothetical protein
VPEQLAPLALRNQGLFYNLLFPAASETLLEIVADPRHLGARIGMLAVLHTWSQNLGHPPHLHCLVPAGGLALDRSCWIRLRRNFFLPVRVLSGLFRGKMLAFLKQSYRRNDLSFSGTLATLSQPRAFQSLLFALRKKDWVVYAKPPFGGPEHVLKYLARYTHRVDARRCLLSHTAHAPPRGSTLVSDTPLVPIQQHRLTANSFQSPYFYRASG